MIDRIALWSAVAAVISGTASAFAQQAPSSDSQKFSLDRPAYMVSITEANDTGLLQSELRDHGWGGDTLDQYGVKIGGHISVGYNYNFQNPRGNANGFGRFFDNSAEDPQLDQIDIWAVRDPIISSSTWDMGFTFEALYGSDGRFIQANGMNFYGSGTPPIGQQYPDEQISIVQGCITLNAPWGNGVVFTVGKFVTPWGQEHINTTQNLLYSHSYIFAVSQPQTLTGVTAKYAIDSQWSVMGGVVVGWDQALEDNNDMISVLGQVGYKYSDEWDFLISAIVGPEIPDNRSDSRFLLNAMANWKLGDDWGVGFEGVVGYEPDVGTEFKDVVVDQFGTLQRQFLATGDDATWYAAAVYSSYKLTTDGMITLNMRGEWFGDAQGARYFPTEVYEATAALVITPFMNDKWGKGLVIRPEVRIDYSNDEVFDSGQQNTQQTIAIQAIYKF